MKRVLLMLVALAFCLTLGAIHCVQCLQSTSLNKWEASVSRLFIP